MLITIQVYKECLLVQAGQGMLHRFYDWVMVLDMIRHEDSVLIKDYTESWKDNFISLRYPELD